MRRLLDADVSLWLARCRATGPGHAPRPDLPEGYTRSEDWSGKTGEANGIRSQTSKPRNVPFQVRQISGPSSSPPVGPGTMPSSPAWSNRVLRRSACPIDRAPDRAESVAFLDLAGQVPVSPA